MKKVRVSASPLNIGALIGWIAASQSAGIIGSFFTVSAIPGWYQLLQKPAWNPPGWVFGPVWTLLYTLMGIAAYRIWKLGMRKKQVRQAIILFSLHLGVNALWSIIFFGFQDILMAFLEIMILLGLIVKIVVRFYKLDKAAAYLLIPYLVWVSFATFLTYTILQLNP